MSLRENLGNSVREYGVDGKKSNLISRAYHSFFEGYSEVAVLKPNGKGTRIKRVYTGDYYTQDLTAHRRIFIRLLYVALFLCAVFLYISSAILPLTSNSVWYVALTQAFNVPFLFWILIAFISYLPAPKNMTIADYRSSSRSLLKATFGSTVCFGLAALATLIFIIFNSSNELLAELFCTAKYIMGGMITMEMYRIEKKVNYLIIPSKNTASDDAIEIS